MSDKVPSLTHLQFLVLGTLVSSEQPGREIRRILQHYRVRSTSAAFYQMMARLERTRLVEGWYEQITVGDQAVTERRYRITAAGERLWSETQAFYQSVAAAAARKRWSNA